MFNYPLLCLQIIPFHTHAQNVMMDITAVRTLVTSLDGDDLCTQTACSPSPCRNDGSCDLVANDPTGLGYTCSCSIGYTGGNCEVDIDECREGTCRVATHTYI